MYYKKKKKNKKKKFFIPHKQKNYQILQKKRFKTRKIKR